MVKLVFLGTGGDCLVVGKQERASGGLIIKDAPFQFHIDPGPSALASAREWKVNIRENSAVFVTSTDLIHANDMGAVVMAMTLGGLDRHGSLYVLEQLSIEAREHSANLDKVILLSPGHNEYVRDYEIIPTLCQNLLPRIGIRFNLGPFIIGYPGDTSFTEAIAEKYKHVSTLILHCRNPSDVEECEKFITHAQPRIAIISYFGVKILEADPSLIAKDLFRKTRVKTIAAEDGMTLDLNELFFNKNQTHLSGFLKGKQ